MKHLKTYNFFESKVEPIEIEDKVLINLTTANGAVPKSWSFSPPIYFDFTEICKQLGNLTNDEYTNQIIKLYTGDRTGANRNLKMKIARKINNATSGREETFNLGVRTNKFKEYAVSLKNIIFDGIKNNGYVVINNSFLYKIIDRKDIDKEREFLNKLFSLKMYINSGKSDEDIQDNNNKVKDIISDIETISYLIEDSGYSHNYKYIVLADSVKVILSDLTGYYISGISIEIKDSTQFDSHLKEFLDRYINLLKDHLDYIDSDKITLTGDKIKILL
jgi:regulator of extracellular matrix RemA (YlzA/DUF370 family)